MTDKESVLQEVLQYVQLSESDRQSITDDAQLIQNWILGHMMKASDEFRSIFRGLCLTGIKNGGFKLQLPNEIDFHIKLELPCHITPHNDKKRESYVNLSTPQSYNGIFVDRTHNMVDGNQVLSWILDVLYQVPKIVKLISGRRYTLVYPFNAVGAHTIAALLQTQNDNIYREINFDFVPVFKFKAKDCPCPDIFNNNPNCFWYAVPGAKRESDENPSNRFSFMLSAPHFLPKKCPSTLNKNKSLYLIKTLRDINGMFRLSSCMLKTVYLLQDDEYCGSNTFEILIFMMQKLLDCLNEEKVPYFLNKFLEHADQLNHEVVYIQNHISRLYDILSQLKKFTTLRYISDIDRQQIREIFGIK